jgi:maleate cis-trans isomerase
MSRACAVRPKAAVDPPGTKLVAALTPYQSAADHQVRGFLEKQGSEVTKMVGRKFDTATSIAHTPRSQIIDVLLNQLNGDGILIILRAGTNLSTFDMLPALEKQVSKPQSLSMSRASGTHCAPMEPTTSSTDAVDCWNFSKRRVDGSPSQPQWSRASRK